MELKYLGTAAAEGFPAFYCDCDNCRIAKEKGGKNIRSRSQAILDDKILIDFPCDTYWHLTQNNIDILDANYCLITHIHSDHFYPTDLAYMRKGFSHPPASWKFSVYGSQDTAEVIDTYVESSNGFLCFNQVEPFKPFKVEKYTVTALKAEHGTKNPYFYMISDGEKTILYAHDTDYFPKETWDYLEAVTPHFDLVSLDCTEGAFETLPYKGHMCLGTNILCRDELLKKGYINTDTKVVLNHFSHNGKNSCYDDFKVIAEKEGFIVSFDNMSLTI